MTICKSVSLAACALASVAAVPAMAQDRATAAQDENPFTLSFELQGLADDNVYAADSAARSDVGVVLRPAVAADLRSGSYRLEARGELAVRRFAKETGENTNDTRLSANLQVEPFNGTVVTVGGRYDILHEDRGDPDNIALAVAPLKYSSKGMDLRVARELSRLRLSGGLRYLALDYTSGVTAAGTTIVNDQRDRNTLAGAFQASFAISGALRVYSQADISRVNYVLAPVGTAYNRDSSEWHGVAGFEIAPQGPFSGKAYFGYMRRSFTDARFVSVGAPEFGANVTYRPATSTRFDFDLTRSYQETTFRQSQAVLSTSYRIKLTHQLLDSLTANVGGTYAVNGYVPSADATRPPRRDTSQEYQLGVDYRMFRGITLKSEMRHSSRNSTEAASGFARNRVFVTLAAEM